MYGKNCARIAGYCKQRMGTLKKNQQEMLESKNTVGEMKSGFDRLISRCDKTKERISKLENRSVELLKLKSKEKRN